MRSIISYLFILCIEKLAHAIMNQVRIGKWKLLRLYKNALGISHLIFVDHLIIFSKANPEQVSLVL